MHKWGFALTSIRLCGAVDETAANVTMECPLRRATGDTMDCCPG